MWCHLPYCQDAWVPEQRASGRSGSSHQYTSSFTGRFFVSILAVLDSVNLNVLESAVVILPSGNMVMVVVN